MQPALQHQLLASKFPLSKRCSVLICFFLSGMALLGGCIERGRNAPMMENYTLEYPSPFFESRPRLDQTVKVERFSVAKAFNTQSIVYRPDPYKLDAYSNHSWIVNPGFMVCDFLVRDLRNSGLFSGIFSYRDYEEGRFILEGSLEEILETDESNVRSASLTMSVALLDLSRSGMPGRLIYQKKYHSSEPLGEKTVDSLVKAMSANMKKLSFLIINDAYTAISPLAHDKSPAPGSPENVK